MKTFMCVRATDENGSNAMPQFVRGWVCGVLPMDTFFTLMPVPQVLFVSGRDEAIRAAYQLYMAMTDEDRLRYRAFLSDEGKYELDDMLAYAQLLDPVNLKAKPEFAIDNDRIMADSFAELGRFALITLRETGSITPDSWKEKNWGAIGNPQDWEVALDNETATFWCETPTGEPPYGIFDEFSKRYPNLTIDIEYESMPYTVGYRQWAGGKRNF